MIEELVSIITPSYNSGEFISKTIESVLSQSYKNWEMLIVDDFSKDNSIDVIKGYLEKDSRIKLFENTHNQGAAESRNVAIRASKGKYVAFLDSDDLWDSQKLERQIHFMSKHKIDFCCTDYEKIDAQGKLLGKIVKCPKTADYNRILLDCPVGNSTVVYNVASLGKTYVPNIRKRNDDALWLKMLRKTQYIYGLNETLAYYRVRADSLSSNKLDLLKHHWFLYRKIEKLSIPRSAFHIFLWGVIKILKIK